MFPARLLPAINPFLPEIAIREKFAPPPAAAEERPRVPYARVGIPPIRRSERAVEIPVRTKHNLSVTRLVEVGAEHERVHVATEDLAHVKVDPRIYVNEGCITHARIPPVRTRERTGKIRE